MGVTWAERLDPKRVTVRDLIVIARDGGGPSFPFISVTWLRAHRRAQRYAGHGRYSLMLNCGSMAPGEGVTQDTKIAPVGFSSAQPWKAAFAPLTILWTWLRNGRANLGAGGKGSILVANGDLAYVIETDRFDVVTRANEFLAATNHFIRYAKPAEDLSDDPLSPWLNFGKPVAVPQSSSHWR